MKSFTKQTNKWILSTMLMAALGSQYYFSVSSNQIHSIEMSSEAPYSNEGRYSVVTGIEADRILEHAEIIKAARGIKPQVEEKKQDEKPAAKAEAKKEVKEVKEETAAQVILKGCTSGCEETVLKVTPAQIAEIKKILSVTEKKVEAETKKKPVAKTEAKKEKVAEKDETASEKRARLKEEAELAKQDLQDERNEKFKDAIENLADICEEKREKLSCMTKGFNRILSQFKKKNKIDAKVVSEAYNDYIAKDLKSVFASLQSREEKIVALEAAAGGATYKTQEMREELNKIKQSTLSLVDDFTKRVPETYSNLKEDTIKAMTMTSISAAVAVNANFKLADQLAKAKKPAESVQAYQQAQIGKVALENNLNVYENSMNKLMQQSGNTATLDFFNSIYVTDMKKVLANVLNLTGTPGSTVSAAINQPGQATTNGRDARSGATTAPATPAANGVSWGTATTNQTGTRTGVQFSP